MDILRSLAATFGVYMPFLGAILFALPSYYGVVNQRKWTGVLLLLALSGLLLIVPTLAVKTGMPFSSLEFNDALGPKFFDATPWLLAIVYPPLLLVTFWFASKFTRSFGRVVIGSVLTTLLHVVLDPATIKLELWQQEASGSFYGVPFMNFAAWFMFSFIGLAIAHFLWGKKQRVKAPVAYSGFALLLFWTGVNAGIAQKIPLSIGSIYALLVLGVIILEKHQFKGEHE